MAQSIDINHASIDDLKHAFQVSQERAEAIVSKRDELGGFKSWDDVKQIPGISEGMIENLKASGMGFGQNIAEGLKSAASHLGLGGEKKD